MKELAADRQPGILMILKWLTPRDAQPACEI